MTLYMTVLNDTLSCLFLSAFIWMPLTCLAFYLGKRGLSPGLGGTAAFVVLEVIAFCWYAANASRWIATFGGP
jgi:hypothetical protein